MRSALVIAITLILVAASLGAGYEAGNSTRGTTTVTSTNLSTSTLTQTTTTAETSTLTSTETTTLTAVSTSFLAVNGSGDAGLLADCGSTPSNGFGTLTAGNGSSPAILCVRYYWFNSTSPMVLNTTGALQIEAPDGNYVPAAQAGNFTVTPSVDQLVLGGPSNINEGTLVAYSVSARPGASGTYYLGMTGMQLIRGTLIRSGAYGELVAGDGQPDYTNAVITLEETYTVGSSPYTVGRVPVPGNNLIFQTVSATNSTQ